ncbi:MAG: Unknown protein [uncultured Thiotrichaceae bacterium]|uniref:Uncharacterized protein n=1 Tax=uncultured Thiotrichaceae bacterium TaxID=298394 RepID=A0A6S6TRW4_9GAMM|nr:MAG: Unknown protein [uncultured Thiotrichaceae bacterium]
MLTFNKFSFLCENTNIIIKQQFKKNVRSIDQCLAPVEAIQRLHALGNERLTWGEGPTLAHDYKRLE